MNKNIIILLISSFLIAILIVFVFPSLFNNSSNAEQLEQNHTKKEKTEFSKENDVRKYNIENSLDYVQMAKDQILNISNGLYKISDIHIGITKYWSFLEAYHLNVDTDINEHFIIAISTVEMLEGFEEKICYNIRTQQYSGYSTNLECEIDLDM